MIHPDTELRFISDQIGYGVFATKSILEGTIVYVKDSLEHVISPTDYLMHAPTVQEQIDKYCYIDEYGNRVVSWDFAKYVNHCCNCNTISTGYGFEIAIRDIAAGEQITDEYGIFNLDRELTLLCGEHNCRMRIAIDDFELHYQDWDRKIRASIQKLFDVPQPLMPFVDEHTRGQLDALYVNPEHYKSVYALKNKRPSL